MGSDVYSGINEMARAKLEYFSVEEQSIIEKFSREWYVTNAGERINLGPTSSYRYILIKPTSLYQEMFNLEREIVVIFSPYPSFQPRTLDAIDFVLERHQSLRLEKICSVLISKDNATEAKLRDLLRSDHEAQIIVPFSYEELLAPYDDYFIRNRFKAHFYTRDLFAFTSPLKKDIYFFGRSDLIYSIVDRHKSHENAGLFGLRKTGKTSVIFGIQRALARMDGKSVFIDCENPAFHRRRWNKALYFIILQMKEQHNLDVKLQPEEKYTEEDAPILFESDLLKLYRKLDSKNLLIIFDEVENITFDISPTRHWATELDFVFFWQTLRAIFQKLDIFTYLIVGTNAMCVESASIHGKDSPIFNQVPFEYIPSFDVPQTREMIRKLGRLMGLKFDEIVYAKLTEDFGGHPFLMRHVCSEINKLCDPERPTFVDKSLYEKAKLVFNQKHTNYIEMILEVLRKFYNDEYAMLEYLAQGDTKTFNEIASLSPYYTNHLLGYGIIEKHRDTYSFKIEAVREYLSSKQRYQKINLTQEEMWKEISERRNALEPKIRLIIRNQLRARFGKASAKQIVLDVLGDHRKSELSALSYEDLFNLGVSKLYFNDLRKIIIKNWEAFMHIFTQGQQDFDARMEFINRLRADAHAAPIDQNEMSYFRVCIGELVRQVEDFMG